LNSSYPDKRWAKSIIFRSKTISEMAVWPAALGMLRVSLIVTVWYFYIKQQQIIQVEVSKNK
jgi:hypothetical protein